MVVGKRLSAGTDALAQALTARRSDYHTGLLTIVGCLLVLLDCGALTAQQPPKLRPFSCEATFRPDTSAADLERSFGIQNVKSAEVYIGEGFAEAGTVVFPDQPEDRIEIVWRDTDQKRSPAWIRIRGTRSNWRTPQGLSLGSDLRTLERVNRRPFRILSFDVDYAGSVLSWSGGFLERKSPAGCMIGARLMPKPYFDPGAQKLGSIGSNQSRHVLVWTPGSGHSIRQFMSCDSRIRRRKDSQLTPNGTDAPTGE